MKIKNIYISIGVIVLIVLAFIVINFFSPIGFLSKPPTHTPKPTKTVLVTKTPMLTFTTIPSKTSTNTNAPSSTFTETSVPTSTFTPTISDTPIFTPTNTFTFTPSNTGVPATNTSTFTPTFTITKTFTPTFTVSPINITPTITTVSTGKLYYVATNGSDTNACTLTAPCLTIQKAINLMVGGDTVYIRGGTYNEPIKFFYKTNTSGKYMTLSAYLGETVILDGTGIFDTTYSQEGLIYIKATNYVKISGLRVQHSNMAGIYIVGSDHVIIEKNSTYDTVKSGISSWGSSNILIDSNDVSLACVDHPNLVSSEEPITTSSGFQVEIKNNVVHNGPIGQNSARAGGEGINEKDNSSYVYVHDNEVYGLTDKVGLSVDAWGGNLNHIYIYNNISHNNLVGLLVSNERNLGSASDVFVYNNLIYDNSYYGIYTPNYMGNGPIANVNITNNTVVDNIRYGFYLVSTNATNIIIKNNIIIGNGSPIYLPNSANYFLSYNFSSGDPLFVSPSTNNFHLQTTSPACISGENGTYAGAYSCNLTILQGQTETSKGLSFIDYGLFTLVGIILLYLIYRLIKYYVSKSIKY